MRHNMILKLSIIFVLAFSAYTNMMADNNQAQLDSLLESMYDGNGFEMSVSIANITNKYDAPKQVLIEDTKKPEYISLLNYVFFEQGEAEIPERYSLYKSMSQRHFNVFQAGYDDISIYHNLLNIIGYRMQKYPDATIKIVGCTDNITTAEKRPGLGMRRAITVADYLIGIWGVAESRIEMTGQNLPDNPSANQLDSMKTLQENRRVEIYSDNAEILKPYHKSGYHLFQNQFEIQIKDKNIDLSQFDKRNYLQIYSGKKRIGSGYFFKKGSDYGNAAISETVLDKLLDIDEIGIRIQLRKPNNDRVDSKVIKVPVIRTSKLENINTPQACFKLVNININEQGLDKTSQKMLDEYLIDKSGDINNAEIYYRYETKRPQAMYNRYESAPDVDYGEDPAEKEKAQKLTEARKTSAQKALKAISAYLENKSVGNIVPKVIEWKDENNQKKQYDNTLPEGRYYNRAIIIEINTK